MYKIGGIAFYILLAVIILGAFLMVGGTQKTFISPPTGTVAHQIDTSATKSTPNNSLQLNSLKFK